MNFFLYINRKLIILLGLIVTSLFIIVVIYKQVNLSDIEINERGLDHPLYKNKKKKFNTPAFNFDEVVTMPQNSVLLASNPINKVQGLNFKVNDCDIWGLQYHPEITYNKMINIIVFRKEKLLKKEAFSDEKEISSHIKHIESENKKLDKISRMRELKNWLNYLNLE